MSLKPGLILFGADCDCWILVPRFPRIRRTSERKLDTAQLSVLSVCLLLRETSRGFCVVYNVNTMHYNNILYVLQWFFIIVIVMPRDIHVWLRVGDFV